LRHHKRNVTKWTILDRIHASISNRIRSRSRAVMVICRNAPWRLRATPPEHFLKASVLKRSLFFKWSEHLNVEP
jgi:hypothetical protein